MTTAKITISKARELINTLMQIAVTETANHICRALRCVRMPKGSGRFGRLIRSISMSNESLMAFAPAVTSAPVSAARKMISKSCIVPPAIQQATGIDAVVMDMLTGRPN